MTKVNRSRQADQLPDGRLSDSGVQVVPQPAPRTELRFTLVGFLVLTMGLIIASGCLVLWASRNAARFVSTQTMSALGDIEEGAAPRPVPAWGELSVVDVGLDWPEEYASFEVEPPAPTWIFAGATRDQVASMLSKAQVPREQIERALEPGSSQVTEQAVILHPDLALALALTPQSRAELYGALGKDPANRVIHDPYRMSPADLDTWVVPALNDAQLVGLLRKLVYPCGKLMCLSDYELLLQKIPDRQQRISLSKALARRRVVDLGLRVRPETDLDKLVGYWTHGARSKDLRPFLEAMQRQPRGGTVDISYVLPPFARLRLYTYPASSDRADDPKLNCHWSTFNFFNETPDDRFADWKYANAYLTEHFFRVGKASRYGDLVFFVSSRGEVLHSAVYLAEDIVFTKNGRGVGQPWVLMHFQDLLDLYGYTEPVAIFAYRSNES